MKIRVVVILILMCGLAQGTCPLRIRSKNAEGVKVGLFYYVWYNDNSTWSVFDKPTLGFYNSSDPKTIRRHLDWFAELNIDFLIVSWWGPNSFSDNSTKLLFSLAKQERYPINITLMVEAYEWSGVYRFDSIFEYINSTYLVPYSDIYMRLENSPLICLYNDNINMTRTEDNRTAIYSNASATGFTARIIGHSPYVNWYAWTPCTASSSQTLVLSEDGFTTVEPRYDYTHKENTSQAIFDPSYTEGLYEKQWRQVINWTETQSVKYVAIYSWNEYFERSQIEPHTTDCVDSRLPFCLTAYYSKVVHDLPPVFQEKAVGFLEAQLYEYANGKWLCREYPNSTTYWLYNDNYLAYRTLQYFNRETSAARIESTFESYNVSIEGNDRLEVLFGRTIPFPPYCSKGTGGSPNIDSSQVGEGFTVRNDEKSDRLEDWAEYADLLLYGVIDLYYQGNSTYLTFWNEACGMFDGKGMKDNLSDGTRYETYKLALFVIASRIIGNRTINAECALGILWRLQDKSNGGVYTFYSSDLSPVAGSTPNVETTSLSIYATVPKHESEFPLLLVLPILIVAALIAALVYKRRHMLSARA